MSDMPERIWAWAWEVDRHRGQWTERQEIIGEGTEYVRADALPAAQVTVKPLEWTEIQQGRYYEARVIGILYSIRLGSDGVVRWQAGYMGAWHEATTIEAAKAATQADYDARIRSALTVTPAPDAAKVAALVDPESHWGDFIKSAVDEAEKAMRKYPQPNYVISKVAEEAGEVVKAAIHCAEGRDTTENVRGEMLQLIAMLYRIWVEGDQVHGLPPVSAALAAWKEGK